MKSMCQSELFNFINQVSFVLDDITLFLNTHPGCQPALEAYNHNKMLRKEAINDYTQMYGPISRYDVNVDNYWDWVMRPWPWEGTGEC